MAKTLKAKSSTTAAKARSKKPTKTKAVKSKAAPNETTTKEPSFMWRLLKQKEAERKRNREETKKLPFGFNQPPLEKPNHSGPVAFLKFAGPRRKAG